MDFAVVMLFMLVPFALVLAILHDRQRRIRRKAGRRPKLMDICTRRTYETPLAPEECLRRLQMKNIYDVWTVQVEGDLLRFVDSTQSGRCFVYRIHFWSEEKTMITVTREPQLLNLPIGTSDMDSVFVGRLDCTALE